MTDSFQNLERRYRSGIKGLYARMRSNYNTIHEVLGEEGIALIEKMSHRYGFEVAQRAKIGMRDNDIFTVADFVLKIFDNMSGALGESVEVSERNASRIVIKLQVCPLRLDNPAICQAHTIMEKTVVEELNPNLRYGIGKSVAAGDSYCEHIIEMKRTYAGNQCQDSRSLRFGKQAAQ